MENWLLQLSDLMGRRDALRVNRLSAAELKQAVVAIDPALKDLARVLGIMEADKLSHEVLLRGIQHELTKREEDWVDAAKVLTLVEASAKRLEELEDEQNKLQGEKRNWKTAWTQVVTSISMTAEAIPDEASAALEIWHHVPSTVTQLEDRERRVEGMKRDMRSFEARTSALFAQLGELEMGIGPDAAIKTVAGRLSKALQTQSRAEVANDRVSELNAHIVTATSAVEKARETFNRIASGLPTSAERADQLAELEARDSILETIQQQRQTLVSLGRGQTEQALRSALQDFDDAEAAAEIEELNSLHEQHNDKTNEIYASLHQAQNELAALENGVGTEVALQLKKIAEKQLIQNARDWGVKRFAHILLTHAIEHFRGQQEAPLLKRASDLFALLTAGNFTGIEQEFDEKDNLQLVGRRDPEHTVCLSGMSEGTLDQLYLALRLAFLEDYSTKTEPLPFIGDDLLTNFDDERTQRGITALAAVGHEVQPILFTHHQRVVDVAQSELGSAVDIIALQ